MIFGHWGINDITILQMGRPHLKGLLMDFGQGTSLIFINIGLANVYMSSGTTVKPVCNDHLYNKIYYLSFIQ